MANIANILLGQLGKLLGDAEVSLYKLLKKSGKDNITVDEYTIRIGHSESTNQIKAVFVNEVPVLKADINIVLNALEALENSLE